MAMNTQHHSNTSHLLRQDLYKVNGVVSGKDSLMAGGDIPEGKTSVWSSRRIRRVPNGG